MIYFLETALIDKASAIHFEALCCNVDERVIDSAANGQEADSKQLTDVRTANGYKSAHGTIGALKHQSTVCWAFAVQWMVLFSCDNCLHSPKVLLFWFSLNFLFFFILIYQSTFCALKNSKWSTEIFVNRLTSVSLYCVPGKKHRLTPNHWQFSHRPRVGFETGQWWESASSQKWFFVMTCGYDAIYLRWPEWMHSSLKPTIAN